MATVSCALSDLPLEQLTLYQASDPYLSSIFIFHGPVATANATVSSSRIQAHIFTPAGFQSYPRITISPAAPLYAAVNHLPREKQGDEVCRGLAVSMLKYFAELSDPAKKCLYEMARAGKPGGQIPKLFDEMHAADLANRMTKVDQTSDIVRDIRGAFQERKVPWVDIDLVLPAGSIQPPQRPESDDDVDIEENPDSEYGQYSLLIRSLGEPMFLPTSRLKRAPSQPTNVSKSKVFSRSQKEALRLTMCEVVDTEERYVAKLYALVCNVAEEFRLKAQGRATSSSSPDESALETLFPPCLNEILDVNMGFLEVIRHVLEETEKDAIFDIGEDTELPSSVSHRSSRDGKDAIGATAFANALLEWFPRFSQPYANYMHAHTTFTQTLNSFMRDKHSSFSKRVYETGEQRLRSLLMEPVQRLPRYSLLIDTMTSSLPLVHPAVRPFLKARDIIKDICSLDDPASTNHGQSFQRLKELVDGWPTNIVPVGRLISAVEFNELSPPYHMDAQTASPTPESRMTARGLMADLDNAASTVNDSSGSFTSTEIRVAQVYDLHTMRCMQSACGRILFLASASVKSRAEKGNTVDLLALELTAMYEGRANRLIEEIVKARIEGRFSEAERESGKWTIRSPTGTVGNIGMLACVFEEDQGNAMKRNGSSRIRVVFDTPKADCSQILNDTDLEVIVSVSASFEDQYRVDMDSIVGTATSDMVTADSFVPVLSKRLLNILLPLHGSQNQTMTESIVHSNFEILRYLASNFMTQVKTPRGFRPPSPSKLLSSLLGGSQSKDSSSNAKAPNSASLLGEFPKMPPPRANHSRSNTLPSVFPGKEDTSNRISVVGGAPAKGQDDQFGLLEQTFAAYALSLQSRSGNIVGRSLRAREHADRSTVNELYNILLEDPSKIQAAAEVPVDTLFVAFETFIANAWRDHMGPILDPPSLKLIQNQFDTMHPLDFDDSFRRFLAEMSPQNRRALASLVRLLAELLDASGNDGDRGALTAAFAEVLTVEGDPMHHVSLLDRLVEDFDNLFEEFIPGGSSLEGTLTCDQTKSASQNAGSISSNASSFRKRFGFSLHREGSKHDGESKVSSILRTLSKSKGSGDSEPNTPKGTLSRSKSIDVDAGMNLLLRPGSRDRPIPGSSHSQDHFRRPGSSQEQPPSLSSIRGSEEEKEFTIRSETRYCFFGHFWCFPDSASEAYNSIFESSSVRIYNAIDTTETARQPRISILFPEFITSKGSLSFSDDFTKRTANKKSDGSSSPPQDIKRRSRATSIPHSRATGLKERPTAVNGSDIKRAQPSSSTQKPQKLRMQSPQKLRDRLQNEKKAQASAQLGLKDELDLIGEEMQALKLVPTQPKAAGQYESSDESHSPSTAILLSRINSLETRFDSLSGEFTGRTSAIEKDLESSLVVSEKRAKKLDELYREASAENEALYDRFNFELNKIARDVRSGNADEALKSQLSGALEEIGRLKKENFRLKREVGGLRAQQAAVALLKASE
ncbi:hypothetical protein MW887_002314 [Aspergillus wentii]|nr:hypothetical protein MW887_002314 [Aspergillus wentii]